MPEPTEWVGRTMYSMTDPKRGVRPYGGEGAGALEWVGVCGDFKGACEVVTPSTLAVVLCVGHCP